MSVNTPVPPASDVYLVFGESYMFTATAQSTVCFAVNPDFPQISGKTFTLATGGTIGPYPAPAVSTQLNWNAVNGIQNCDPNGGMQKVGKVIHVSSNLEDKHGKK